MANAVLLVSAGIIPFRLNKSRGNIIFTPDSAYLYRNTSRYNQIIAVVLCVMSYMVYIKERSSRDSPVVIATCYGLEGPGIESRWVEIFRTYPDRLRGPSSLLYSGYRVFPDGKGGRGVVLISHPLLVPKLRKSRSIPPLTLWVLMGLLRGSLYLY